MYVHVIRSGYDTIFGAIAMAKKMKMEAHTHGWMEGCVGGWWMVAHAGNPEGDPDTQIDPGWREPAAQLSFSQDGPFLSRDMRYLRPVEGWDDLNTRAVRKER